MLTKLLERLFPGLHEQFPHGLGCRCAECDERRKQREFDIAARIRTGAPPKTLGEILVAEKRRRERMQ